MWRITVIILSCIASAIVKGQIVSNYAPPIPYPMPCYQITDVNGLNQPLHEHSICIESHPDALNVAGYVADVTASSTDVEIKAGEEIIFRGETSLKSDNNFQVWAHIEAPDPIEVAWYHPQNTPGVAFRHEKLELGFDLPVDIEQDINDFFDVNSLGVNELNPYNRYDIDITVSFYRNGVHMRDVDAFYYREMEINNGTKHWDEISTDYNWRVRYSPTEYGGDWSAHINVKATNHADLNRVVTFKVSNSSNPGYLEKGKYNKHLRTSYDKKSFFGVGQALTWPVMEDNSDLDFKINTEEASKFHTIVETFGNSGGNFCRINGWPPGHEFELEALGNYDPRQDLAWDLDRIVDYLEEKDVYMMFVVKHHEAFWTRARPCKEDDPTITDCWKGWEGERWDEHPYFSNRTFSFGNFAHENLSGVIEPIDFFNDPNARDLFKNYVRYVMSRWGYSTSIGAWQIWSEIDHIEDYHSSSSHRSIMHDFLEEIGDYVKNELKIPQLYSCSIGTAKDKLMEMDDAALFTIPYHDFTGIHTYVSDNNGGTDNMRNRNILTRFKTARNFIAGNDEMDLANHASNFYTPILEKPFLFDEYGVDTRIDIDSSDAASDPYNAFLTCSDIIAHNDLWASAMMGSMTTGLDWFAKINPNFGQDNYPAMMHFFSNIDFESMNYDDINSQESGMSGTAQRWPRKDVDINKTSNNNSNQANYIKKDKLEAITMVTDDGHQAFGWVHNRSVYYWNLQNTLGFTCYGDLANGVGHNYGPYIQMPEDDDNVNSPQVIYGHEEAVNNSNKAFFKVKNLQGWTQYHIEFYNTRTGAWVKTFFESTDINGTLKIWVPRMSHQENPDLAYKIFKDDWRSSNISGDTISESIEGINDEQLSELKSNNLDQSVEFSLIPNPTTNGQSTLSITSLESLADLSLVVYDIYGKLIAHTPIQSNSIEINLSNNAPGLYLIKVVQSNNVIYETKLLKM